MMTNEKAIEKIDSLIETYQDLAREKTDDEVHDAVQELLEACVMAKSALLFRIEKKPRPEPKVYGNGICPTCGVYFLDKSTNFCGNCGQHLAWEVKE